MKKINKKTLLEYAKRGYKICLEWRNNGLAIISYEVKEVSEV